MKSFTLAVAVFVMSSGANAGGTARSSPKDPVATIERSIERLLVLDVTLQKPRLIGVDECR
jgi:hypothetical protein